MAGFALKSLADAFRFVEDIGACRFILHCESTAHVYLDFFSIVLNSAKSRNLGIVYTLIIISQEIPTLHTGFSPVIPYQNHNITG